MTKILAICHNLDLITQKMLEEVAQDPEFEVIVACPPEAADRFKAPIRALPMPAIHSKFTWASIKALRKIVKRERPDVSYSTSTSGLSCILMATLGFKCANIGYRGTMAKIRRTDPTYYLGMLNPRVKHVVCNNLDIYNYLSRFIKKSKLSYQLKPFELSWVDEALANPISVAHADGYALRLIYIGSSKGRPHKGMHDLIQAMNLLPQGCATLTVVGECDQEVMDSAPDTVTFMGFRSDAVHFLPTHDVLVLSSTRDASPRVVREAQACSVPCIVTDIPGARDLIVDGVTGLLCPPSNPQALAETIQQMASDRQRLAQMGKAARQHIADNFRMEDYLAYYKTLFSKKF